ncbi:MAG: hypothetical protein ACO1TE_29345 [Prosthecobacter sp.]
MTSGNAGKKSTPRIHTAAAQLCSFAAATMCLLASCADSGPPLRPAWQQDSHLHYQGVPARAAQTSTTPHMVARVIYAAPAELPRLVERQGDVADNPRGFARMGDGTLDLGLQDVVTGKWIESYLCGGTLFVSGLPNQAYRIVVKNRTPMPLELSIGVDGRDFQSGGPASLRRGSLHVAPRGTLSLDRSAQGPLLFRAVHGEGALFDTSPRGRPGMIHVAAYLASDAPSAGPEKMRPSQIAPLGLFPIGAPEQYR